MENQSMQPCGNAPHTTRRLPDMIIITPLWFLILDYLIPGTATPDGKCVFSYQSANKKQGDFNSPRFPGNYPNGINCTYTFIAAPNEQVAIIFDYFKIRADSANATIAQYGSV